MTEGPDRKAVNVRIRGRVQGVWFRAWTIEEASGRRLDGWVRNRRDGSVEAVIAGPAAAVDAMVARCWEGPPSARVADVVETPFEGAVAPGFIGLPTA
jgi:acylphosphatase